MEKFTCDKMLLTASLVCLAGLGSLVTVSAIAGADTTFDPAGNMVSGWVSGSLGRMVALGSLGIGVVSAIVSRTLMPVVVSAGVGIAASVGPSVLLGIVTATL